MPYLYPTEESLEEASDEQNLLVCLSERDLISLLSIVPMLEWANRYKYSQVREWAENTHVRLMEVTYMNDLTMALQAMTECVCQLTDAVYSGAAQEWPSDYEGENAGWEPDPPIPPFTGGSTPPTSTGASTIGEWTTYFCKAINLIRESVLKTLDELRTVFAGPVIYIGFIVAVFTVIVAVLSVGALPVLILGVSTAYGLASAIVNIGLDGIDAAQVWFEDSSDTHWRNMACLMVQESDAESMADVMIEYMQTNAPSVILPFINNFPWLELIQQALIGEDANGIPLADVSGFPELCGNCGGSGQELLSNPEMNTNLTGWYLLDTSPCQNAPSHINGVGAKLGCHVPRSDYGTDFTVLAGDVGETLTVSWVMDRAGSAVGGLDRVRIAPTSAQTSPVKEWERTNQNGEWSGLSTWVPDTAGAYTIYFMANNSETVYNRMSILREL